MALGAHERPDRASVIVTKGAAHSHRHESAGRVLLLATLATIGYAVVEAAAGWWSVSLALPGDAGNMITDAVALLIAALAARKSRGIGWVAAKHRVDAAGSGGNIRCGSRCRRPAWRSALIWINRQYDLG